MDFARLAGATGLEPAASGVTGRRSNQLSYAPAGNGADLRPARRQVKERSARRDGSPPARGRRFASLRFASRRLPAVVAQPRRLVGGDGLEPPTSCV